MSTAIVGAGAAVLTGGTAHAASFSLSVSAIGRTGTAVDIKAHAVNLRTGDGYDLTSGRARRLPKGSYSVGSVIRSADRTVTLGVRTVRVDRTTKVAFDAREGRKVDVTVDEPDAEIRDLQLVPLVIRGSGTEQWAVNTPPGTPPGETYVIPVKSKYLGLVTYAHLEKAGSWAEVPSPYRFDLAYKTTGGMPADVSFSARRADLAEVTMTVRSAGRGERGLLSLSPAFSGSGAEPAVGGTEFRSLPARIVSYRTPGIRWLTQIDTQSRAGDGGVHVSSNDRPVYQKGATSETYRAATWSPGLETSLDGRYLRIWPSPLTAPGFGGFLETPAGRSAKLYRGSTLVAKSSGGNGLKAKLPTKAATYTLEVTTDRGTLGVLSATTSTTWKFKARGYSDGAAHGGARILSADIAPQGLDERNTAARGTTTTVGLDFNASSMKTVAVEVSFDGGTTWNEVPVVRSGRGHLVAVANPDDADMVSLRVKATEAKGSSVSQTILNAYGVR